jgi:hypothetical protein
MLKDSAILPPGSRRLIEAAGQPHQFHQVIQTLASFLAYNQNFSSIFQKFC